MKILYITHYTALYGANRSLLALVRILSKSSCDVHVLAPAQGAVTKELDGLKIPYSVASYHDEYYYKTGFSRLLGLKRHFQNRWYFRHVLEVVKNIKPDIIHSNSSSLHIGAKLSQELSLPHVWHIREFGLLDYKAAHNLGERHHLKWLNRAAHVIAISQILKKTVLQKVHVPTSVIYNGVMPQLEMEAIQLKGTKNNVVFMLAGSFRKEKGQLMAVKAFARVAAIVPNALLHLPGDTSGNYGQAVVAEVKKEGLEEKVFFPGFISKVNELYKDVDILLMLSKNEAMGRVTGEAFARYIPVIAYNGGANPELITHGKDGFLYKKEEELINQMQILATDEKLRVQMGKAGHKKALQLFTEEHYAEQVEAVYNKVFIR